MGSGSILQNACHEVDFVQCMASLYELEEFFFSFSLKVTQSGCEMVINANF
jgi:hypothetical protein